MSLISLKHFTTGDGRGKVPIFALIYESTSFGRVAPEENFGGFILSFPIFTARATPGGCGGVSPPREDFLLILALKFIKNKDHSTRRLARKELAGGAGVA